MSVEVFSIGRVNIDVCLGVDRLPASEEHRIAKDGYISAGGSAANFAAQMARLGVKTGLISCIGNDLYGQTMLRDLGRAGVDTSTVLVLDKQPTGIFLSIVDDAGKRNVVVQPGANKFLEKHVLDESLLVRASTIHMAGGFPMMTERAAEIATVNGIVFSFDPGRAASSVDFKRVLPQTDLLFMNEHEVKTYAGINPNESALRRFAKTFPGILVVKLAQRGAVATDGFEFCKSEAFNVKVVDTLGAGDAFAAGFVAAWTRCEKIEQALHMANAVAALTIRERGAQNGQPSLDETAKFLSDHGISIDNVLRTFRRGKKRRR